MQKATEKALENNNNNKTFNKHTIIITFHESNAVTRRITDL